MASLGPYLVLLVDVQPQILYCKFSLHDEPFFQCSFPFRCISEGLSFDLFPFILPLELGTSQMVIGMVILLINVLLVVCPSLGNSYPLRARSNVLSLISAEYQAMPHAAPEVVWHCWLRLTQYCLAPLPLVLWKLECSFDFKNLFFHKKTACREKLLLHLLLLFLYSISWHLVCQTTCKFLNMDLVHSYFQCQVGKLSILVHCKFDGLPEMLVVYGVTL